MPIKFEVEVSDEEIEKAIDRALEVMPGHYVYECLIGETEGNDLVLNKETGFWEYHIVTDPTSLGRDNTVLVIDREYIRSKLPMLLKAGPFYHCGTEYWVRDTILGDPYTVGGADCDACTDDMLVQHLLYEEYLYAL